MRKLAVSLGLIAMALALLAAPALGAYKTSPEEGRKYAKKHRNDFPGPSSVYTFRNCWRIGSGGALPGGVVCRFSNYTPGSTGEHGCLLLDIAVKQAKKRRGVFVTLTVSRPRSDR